MGGQTRRSAPTKTKDERRVLQALFLNGVETAFVDT